MFSGISNSDTTVLMFRRTEISSPLIPKSRERESRRRCEFSPILKYPQQQAKRNLWLFIYKFQGFGSCDNGMRMECA